MRLTVFLICVLIFPHPSVATDDTTRIYEEVSSRVFGISARDATGHQMAYGSAVLVQAPNIFVTNCHIIDGATEIQVISGDEAKYAKPVARNSDRDLCLVRAKSLKGTPLALRDTKTISIGESVFAIGNPQGFDKTLSSGIVSGLRKVQGGVLIQTNAAISQGSSGGALVDSEGKLLGVTSFMFEHAQNLNFALPAEWIVGLLGQLNSLEQTGLGDYAEQFTDDLIPKKLFSRATDGDAEAQYKVATLYFRGLGNVQDYAKAFHWASKAAANGHPPAERMLGMLYEHGHGTEVDAAMALTWYEKSAEAGYALAQYELGLIYLNNDLSTDNGYMGFRWLLRAAAQGYIDATYALADTYQQGQGVLVEDPQLSVFVLRAAAGAGHREAQLALGRTLLQGTAPDESQVTEGIQWLKAAAERGNTEAIRLLAQLYDQVDKRESISWLELGASYGDPWAQYRLAGHLLTGEDITQSPVRAYKWFILANSKSELRNKQIGRSLKSMLSFAEQEDAVRRAQKFVKKESPPPKTFAQVSASLSAFLEEQMVFYDALSESMPEWYSLRSDELFGEWIASGAKKNHLRNAVRETDRRYATELLHRFAAHRQEVEHAEKMHQKELREKQKAARLQLEAYQEKRTKIGDLYLLRCLAGQRNDNGTCIGPPVFVTWQEAKKHLARLNSQNYAGIQDWRLPSRSDMDAIASDYCNEIQCGQLHRRFNIQYVWTSTSNRAEKMAFTADMLNGRGFYKPQTIELPFFAVANRN